MKSWKIRLSLGAVAIALLAGSALAEQKSLTVVMVSGDDAAMAPVVKAFETAHPDISIKVQAVPFDQFFQVTDMRLRSKDKKIDLVYTDAPLVAAYAQKGYLEPLDGATTPAEADTLWTKTAIVGGTYDGRLMAFPINSSAQFLFYNKSLFAKAGVPAPDGLTAGQKVTQADIDTLASTKRWTWEQVADAARKMTVVQDGKTMVWGFSVESLGEIYQVQPFGESLGKPVIGPDGYTAKGYLDSAEWKKAATFWSNLYNDWKVSPRDMGWGAAAQLFVNNQLAMFTGGTWNVPTFQSAGIDYGIAPFPYFEGGKVLTPTGSWYMGVSAVSQNKPEAIEFAKFLTQSSEGTGVWYKALNMLPTSKALLASIATDPAYDEFPADSMRLGVYESQNTAKERPVTPAFGPLQDAFKTAFTDISNGVPVDQALDNAVQKFDSAAARMKK
jgi:multiple sugar transport system substrate-binding protein